MGYPSVACSVIVTSRSRHVYVVVILQLMYVMNDVVICVTSDKKLSQSRHLPSKCRLRDNSSFGNTSLLLYP